MDTPKSQIHLRRVAKNFLFFIGVSAWQGGGQGDPQPVRYLWVVIYFCPTRRVALTFGVL